jgi:hypothetical protein
MRLFFSCLRRNIDGSAIEDPTVELRLERVEQISAYYAPANLESKPSDFVMSSRLSSHDLVDWSGQPNEAYLVVNSLQAQFEMDTACAKDELVGGSELDDNFFDSSLRIYLSLQPHSYAKDAISANLRIVCDSMQAFAKGVPLDMATWMSQFEAWWKGWREHWAAKQGDEEEPESIKEDTLIPAAPSRQPNLSYRQPPEPPFEITPTDTPIELLKPIEHLHVGQHNRDWQKMAMVYPNFDQSVDERASQLEKRYLSDDFGRWIYIRHIDSWWSEGNRACVVARGVEHCMPDEGDPATNQETVVSYGLRRSRDRWIIASWSQGWPRFESAPKLPGNRAWRDIWKLSE